MAVLRRMLPALLLVAAAGAGVRQARPPLDFEVELDPQVSPNGGPAGAIFLQAQIQSYLGGRSLAKADPPVNYLPWGPEEINLAPFNCSERPDVCESFNCEKKSIRWRIASNNRVNPNSFCLGGQTHLPAFMNCVAGNLTAYARGVPLPQRKIFSGIHAKMDVAECDAQYCYNAGHCTRGLQEHVYDGMTMDEAEALCDRRYGREAWTAITVGTVLKECGLNPSSNVASMLFNDKVRMGKECADTMAKLACAMGNYHCDQVYCRTWFCDKPPYKDQEYAHLALKSFAGNRTGESA